MHEMSLCEGVLQIIENESQRMAFSSVRGVTLEIGLLSQVEPEAMRFCFDVVCNGSIAEGATLNIIQNPGQAWCMQCADSKTISQRGTACPDCGSYQLQVTGGDEMRVKSLEVD